MTLEHHFNLKRFTTYLKHDLQLNAKKYLAFTIGLTFILLFVDLFAISQTFATTNRTGVKLKEFYIETRGVTFLFSYVFCMLFMIGSSFPSLRTKSGTMNNLIAPVSTLEKFTAQFLLRVVLSSGLFIILFGIEFDLAVSMYNSLGWNDIITVPNFFLIELHPNINSNERLVAGFSLFSYATFLFACATYFQKSAIIKTVITFGVLCIITYCASMLFSIILTPKDLTGFEPVIYDRTLSKDLTTLEYWLACIGIFSSLFFLPLSYFNLKEKEA